MTFMGSASRDFKSAQQAHDLCLPEPQGEVPNSTWGTSAVKAYIYVLIYWPSLATAKRPAKTREKLDRNVGNWDSVGMRYMGNLYWRELDLNVENGDSVDAIYDNLHEGIYMPFLAWLASVLQKREKSWTATLGIEIYGQQPLLTYMGGVPPLYT